MDHTPKFTINNKTKPDTHIPTLHTLQDLGWNSTSNILNLSTLFSPSTPQRHLLEKGLSYIPRPTRLDREELQRDLHHFHRRLKITDYFHNKPNRRPTPFVHPSHWEPTLNHLHPLTIDYIRHNTRALQRFRPPRDIPDNLSGPERRALTDLTRNPNIIIKPADKGSKIIIMDRHQYLIEANRQLNNSTYYKPLTDSIQLHTQTRLRDIIQTLYDQNYITAKQRDFLFGPDLPRPRYFYLLPKIHKPPNTRGLMYKGCVRTKTWRTLLFTAKFRCIKSEMTVELCGASRQLHGWRTHVSAAVDPLATLRGGM